MMKLRYYQRDSLKCAIDRFKKGDRSTLIVLPTGCGKTIVFVRAALDTCYKNDGSKTGKNVLILAHQNILIEQASEKFEIVSQTEVSKEKGKESCIDSEYPVTVSSMQIIGRRLCKFPSDYFHLIIIDEAHHALSKSYKKIIDHFSEAKILGVTATPDRGDKHSLMDVFDSLAYQYDIKTAIKDGFLVPIKVNRPRLEIDLSKVKKKHGDLDEMSLSGAIEDYLHPIAEALHHVAFNRKIVCFVPLIKTAWKAAELFESYGFQSFYTFGNDKEKEEKLKEFESCQHGIMFNSMLLTEGWDCPSVDCVVILRPTTSRSLYVQMVGRGLRLADGKKDCLLVDFLFQEGKFDLACPADLFTKNKEAVKEFKEKEIAEDSDLMEKTEESEQAVNDREKALMDALNRSITVKRKLCNPWDEDKWRRIFESIQRPEDEFWYDGAPTKKQKEVIESHGYSTESITFTQASAMIGEFFKITRKQKYFLLQQGFSEEELENMTKMQAGAIIGKLKEGY